MTLLQAIETTPDTALLEALKSALQTMAEKDQQLLDNSNINERTISFRLAMYLQSLLPDWHVDCEYNGWQTPCHAMKPLVIPTNAAATEARTIYPDIIVHRRDTSENLAVIDIARSTSHFGKHQDVKKLKAYKQQMGFELALLLNIGVGNNVGEAEVDIMQ